jgi:hypothetical protein
MSDGAPLRAVAFGAADGSLWAVAIDDGRAALVLGAGSAGAGLADGVSFTEDREGNWRIEGDGVALTVAAAPPPEPAAKDESEPASPQSPSSAASSASEDGESDPPGPASAPPAPVAAPPGPDAPMLCRVTGTVTAGDEHAVDCAGVRVLVPAPKSAKAAPASARMVAGFLDDGATVALVAVRPRNAGHQDGDIVSAALFDPDAWVGVTEPRLSTTYDGSGTPTRTTLELWVGEGDNEFPRRAAGEVSGLGGSVAADGLALQASPLTCHSRGQGGAGVYALVTF